MLRSHSQVLYSFLPGAVFRHEDRVYGQVLSVDGRRLTDLNDVVIFSEIADYLENWPEDDRYDLPLPRDARMNEYRIISPEAVRWELFPLILECTRRSCGRVRSYQNARDIAAEGGRCAKCGAAQQQLRFYSAHNCGQVKKVYVPKCPTHGYDEISFDNTGSFLTATWRCHGPGCNGAVTSRTNMSPCSCGKWPGPDGVVRMRAHTLDDSRAYRAHYVDLVNVESSTFQTYQRHPNRNQIAVAHFLGLIGSIKDGLGEADTRSDGKRMTAAQWEVKEAVYIEMGLSADEIADLKRVRGPVETGLAALGTVSEAAVEIVAAARTFYERAAVYDRNEVPRMALADQVEVARERGDTLQADAMQQAVDVATTMGISELAVTWEFPIAKVAFGFTREQHEPGHGAIRGFRNQREHDNKYPVYAVATTTEALLVTLSPKEVLTFLHERGEAVTAPTDERTARRQLLEIFADAGARPAPADTIRTLIHTLSHLLLRGLDDGQVGFAESSLAEWMVPETLTFAVYANSLKDFTLGSLWTLLNSRSLSWLRSVCDQVIHCENDPICYQREHRSCERCAYLTFGCRHFNADLDRRVLADFLLSRGALAAARPAAV
ncbi:hypothetical protein [Cellulomonas fengjieae]|uniref:Uncharacterized protein n=1 Tax=Cellulomonas fengjieae TaxID=2819978 RepID=A0ABS3SEB6_9CELL|nr:hypothetical protein [Cellulomonas fengjieae]MBO3084098.1 hypothetical protein [Cellulomonas fengjieae]QVI64647.1 hypothetical protein KG102_10665 [Cellulomonas fengjieae]